MSVALNAKVVSIWKHVSPLAHWAGTSRRPYKFENLTIACRKTRWIGVLVVIVINRDD